MKSTEFNKRQKEFPNIKEELKTAPLKIKKSILKMLNQKKYDGDFNSINDVIEDMLGVNKWAIKPFPLQQRQLKK